MNRRYVKALVLEGSVKYPDLLKEGTIVTLLDLKNSYGGFDQTTNSLFPTIRVMETDIYWGQRRFAIDPLIGGK